MAIKIRKEFPTMTSELNSEPELTEIQSTSRKSFSLPKFTLRPWSSSHATDSESATNSTDEEDYFAARKSNREPQQEIVADNDVWIENFAVTQSINNEGEVIVRPYFVSEAHGRKVWDEPPSGASSIRYATHHARKMAEEQRKIYIESKEFVSIEEYKQPKKRILKSMKNTILKKGENSESNMATDIPATVKTYHIPDKDVQSAIALSLQDDEFHRKKMFYSSTHEDLMGNVVEYTNRSQDIEDDMALATAISLSISN